MTHPVIRVLTERAAARRISLLELVAVIPEGLWKRAARGEAWTARHHLAHALTADVLIADVVSNFEARAFERILDRRQVAVEASLNLAVDTLVDAAADARARLNGVLGGLSADELYRAVDFDPGRSAWGASASLTLAAYLERWAAHDPEHEAAIRSAISTPPDLSAVAYTRKLR